MESNITAKSNLPSVSFTPDPEDIIRRHLKCPCRKPSSNFSSGNFHTPIAPGDSLSPENPENRNTRPVVLGDDGQYHTIVLAVPSLPLALDLRMI
jgi:hypothetical protein